MRVGRWGGSSGWKYAAGEFLLIVAGVLVALSASDWQNRQADRRTELSILGELHTALSADLEFLENTLDQFRRIESRTEVVLTHMRSGASYSDSLDAYFGTVYGFLGGQLNKAGYESVKSQGLGLISDDGLRSHSDGGL